jgi:hypothetical protein
MVLLFFRSPGITMIEERTTWVKSWLDAKPASANSIRRNPFPAENVGFTLAVYF